MSQESSAVRLSDIGQIAVFVDDIDRAVRFYRDTLGMSFLFQTPSGLAFFRCGSVRLLLDRPARETDPGAHATSSIIYYTVPDIRAAHEGLRQRQVEFIDAPHLIAQMPDHDLWMAFFKDTEGNTLALMSEVRPPVSSG